MVKNKNSLKNTIDMLNGLAGMHRDLLKAYQIALATIQAKLDAAEAIAYEASVRDGEIIQEIRRSCVTVSQLLAGVAEPMNEVIAKMEAFTPEDWVKNINLAREDVRATKHKYPKIFKKEK